MFNRDKREEKKKEKLDEIMKKYHLDSFCDDQDIDAARDIAEDMAINDKIFLADFLGAKDHDLLMMLIYQNNVIIKQNNMIARLLEEIKKMPS